MVVAIGVQPLLMTFPRRRRDELTCDHLDRKSDTPSQSYLEEIADYSIASLPPVLHQSSKTQHG